MTRRPSDSPEPIDPMVLEKLLEASAPMTPPRSLRDRVMARVRSESENYITVHSDRTPWRSLATGVEFKLLQFDTENLRKSFLLRAAPGSRLPGHGHRCFEECLVLEGEFSIGPIHLRAGDFHGASEQVQHDEAYTETGVLVYLRAHIEDYPGVNP